ncbi:phage holin family protein [Olsenella sp. Marseille-QA0557]|uniref:Phage holin family protein n=1 Tax=Candidatus Coprovicinus avistercoris TaxID=2840754 RepID=A0A9D1HWB6_9ACTN|nr:phage holin family protein [Candidatus Coprovicinus avistercoris]
MRFILTWLTTAIAVSVAIWIVPGIGVIGDIYVSTLSTALALAFLNALIKPVVQFFALPITCLTLGLFSLVINASMLELASYLSRAIFNSGIYIMSFGSALVGAIIISIVTALLGIVFDTSDEQ